MREYQKIDTLFKFDGVTKTYIREFNNPYVEYLKNNKWICSSKYDGTNIRVLYDGHRVSWSGRTDKSELPKEVEAVLQYTFGDSEVLFEQMFGEKEVMLFMECYGGKIQGGLYGGNERLIGFDVMVNGMYLDKLTISEIFEKFGVETVEFFTVDNLDYIINKELDDIKNNTIPLSNHATEDRPTEVEGYVCVPAMRLYDAKGNRIIVKVKYKDLQKLRKQ